MITIQRTDGTRQTIAESDLPTARKRGHKPVVEVRPAFDPATQRLVFDPKLDTVIEAERVVDTWRVEPLPAPGISEQLRAVWAALPVDARAQFLALKPAVHDAIADGDLAAVRLLISSQAVPVELEAAKAALLAILDQPSTPTLQP